jgi:hypothetical protein
MRSRDEVADERQGRWSVISSLKPASTDAILNTLRMMGSQVHSTLMLYFFLITTNRSSSPSLAGCSSLVIEEMLLQSEISFMTGCLLLILAFVVFTIVLPAYGVYGDIFWYPVFFKILIWQNGPGILTMFVIVFTINRVLVRVLFQVRPICSCFGPFICPSEARQLCRDSKSFLLCDL